MKVELISVGTEVLLGDIVNTNTAYLSKQLAKLGIGVYKHTTVGDNKERLLKVLDNAYKENDTVIITGGLGPTADDITKECVAEYFGRELYFDMGSWNNIEKRLQNSKIITKNNKKQALIPEGAKIIKNYNGTAPGIIIEEDNKKIILLPGPPREMQAMYEKSIKPYLEKYSKEKYMSKYIRFYGIGESALEEEIKTLLEKQTNPTIALYAKTGEVLVRITANAKTTEECANLLDEKLMEIEKLVGEYIYLIGDEKISESQTELHTTIDILLKENDLTISVAESLTGGKLTEMLVEQSGISKNLLESVICYSNKSKIHTLGVKEETIKKYSAVSEQTAKEMVFGVAKRLDSDVAVATTGVAGPNKDENNNPVGLVYVATYYKGDIRVEKYNFVGDRELIRTRATTAALNALRKHILDNIE